MSPVNSNRDNQRNLGAAYRKDSPSYSLTLGVDEGQGAGVFGLDSKALFQSYDSDITRDVHDPGFGVLTFES